MIVSKTPFRITLGGGGTDLPSYYENHKGFLISTAINRYVYVAVNSRFEGNIRFSYSKTEIVDSVDQLEHPIAREALRLLNIDGGIEIVSISDLPAGSGLGSSGAFTVGLLNALHVYRGEFLSPRELAEEAFHLEAEILGEPVGKQDQYIAAYGGAITLEIETSGSVTVVSNVLPKLTIEKLKRSLLFLYTGKQRRASDILRDQGHAAASNDGSVLQCMHEIKKIGRESLARLCQGDMDWFGRSLDRHWQIKKNISTRMSNSKMNEWYEIAKKEGALGGKIMGAGGGGFFMFCVLENRSQFLEAMIRNGLIKCDFSIESEGSKVLVDLK